MKSPLFALSLALLACTVYARETINPGVIESQTLARATASWNGSALPAYPEGEPEVTILKVTIPPKTALPWHEHPYINAGVLLSGELTVEAESGETLHLKPGDPIVELVNTWHHGVNNGDIPAEIIVFYAGEKDMPVTIKKP